MDRSKAQQHLLAWCRQMEDVVPAMMELVDKDGEPATTLIDAVFGMMCAAGLEKEVEDLALACADVCLREIKADFGDILTG